MDTTPQPGTWAHALARTIDAVDFVPVRVWIPPYAFDGLRDELAATPGMFHGCAIVLYDPGNGIGDLDLVLAERLGGLVDTTHLAPPHLTDQQAAVYRQLREDDEPAADPAAAADAAVRLA